jgi:HSP20 family molecular chaperone IbpA
MKMGIIAYQFPLLQRLGQDVDPPDLFLPALEVVQRDDSLIVRADVPGMRRDDLKLEINQNELTIAGERRAAVDACERGICRSERRFGAFFRSVPLPERADVEHVTATVKDGVLEVVLPIRMLVIALIAAAFALATSPAQAQRLTRCAECHLANLTNVPSPDFLSDWQRSAPARRGVGCDKCHGADSWTEHSTEAHRGVLNSSNAGVWSTRPT